MHGLRFNTRLIMSASALLLFIAGLGLTFVPDLILKSLQLGAEKTNQLLIQVLGGLYFGFAMLNWMTRNSIIGGIYNRPVAIANFSHFFIAGLALLKGVNGDGATSMVLWITTGTYQVFWILFAILLFSHPLEK